MTEESDDDIRERAIAVAHERLWRSVATLAMLNISCPLRRCRRHGSCQGPIWPSAHQAPEVAEHEAMGFSGWAVCALPACITVKDEAAFADLKMRKGRLRALLDEHLRLRLPRFICMEDDQSPTSAGHRGRRGRPSRFRAICFALTQAADKGSNG